MTPSDSTQPNSTSSSLPEMKQSSTGSSVISRDSKGRFPKETSGNYKGRTKGSKGQITQLRLGLEQALREQIGESLEKVAAKAVQMALNGNTAMIKLLLELFISKPQALDEGEGGITKITLNVRKLELGEPRIINEPEIIDVTPIEEPQS